MKKWLDTIWAPFDNSDPIDIILLSFAYFWLAVLLAVSIGDLWK